MLPGSHTVPINNVAPECLHSPKLLADAFSEFISASSLLEGSYRELQREVAHLGGELAERNAALTRSVAENDHMRGALQQIIDSMPCGVLVLDTAETVITINPEGRRLLELGSTDVRSLRDIRAMSQIDLEALSDGAEREIERESCLAFSGVKRWLAISNRKLACTPASQGSVSNRKALQSLWIFRDITANKQAEHAREAARSAMALAEVSTVLAHEIRNPLASMELFAGLIVEDPGQTTVWVSHLRAGIRMLSATVNNALSIHAGSDAHLGMLDLAACIESGVNFVQPIAEQAGVSLSFAVEAEGLKVCGNENLLRQILLNLICNAIRHTPSGGEVHVLVRTSLAEGVLRALVSVKRYGLWNFGESGGAGI